MATALLPQPQHHFSAVPGHYSPTLFDPYTGQHSIHTTSSTDLVGTSSQPQLPYTSPQRWAAQQAFQRLASKSPNIRDRTPIRHNRPDMNRHRSSSRPEVLLAYAEEQVRQAQQGQAESIRQPYIASMETTNSPYQPQQYAFPPSVTSPYLSQQPYFDNAAVQNTYGQLAAQQDVSNGAAMYNPGRPQMQLAQVPGVALNPTETLYSQPRPTHLPAVNAIPSNFPPIPQPLESTPNEVDVVGSRQKPQCWDHGCNGRQFSTFSNLLRHQREKSGTATKARCPHCGTEFTRTTARNGHMFGGKCKGMPEQSKDGNKQTKQDMP